MKNNFRYQLDESRPRIKFTCPQCGRAKKLVRYIDTWNQTTFPSYVGRCDRQFKCGYHYTPKNYFHDNPWLRETNNQAEPSVKPKYVIRQPSYIDSRLMEESMTGIEQTPLFSFLSKRFGEAEIMRLYRLYNVGASRLLSVSTIFWQVDINGFVRTGKIMRYGSDGYRVKKDGIASFQWMHRLIAQSDFNLVQCFFGEHLLKVMPDAKVMIVESEKSAIIASHFYPRYVWLASGGSSGCLNPAASQVLRGREVWLIPDLDAEDYWRAKLPMLRCITPTVGLSNCISRLATAEQRAAKLDIADFLLESIKPEEPIVGATSRDRQLAEQ